MNLGAMRTLIIGQRRTLLAIAVAILVIAAAYLTASVLSQARELAAGGPPESSIEASPSTAPQSHEPETTQAIDPTPPARPDQEIDKTPASTPGPIAGWQLTGTFDGGEWVAGVHDVADWGGTFLALGESWESTDSGSTPKPRLWHSADGQSWSELALDLGPGASVQVVAPMADGSLMILGTIDGDILDWSDPLAPTAWTSRDAVAWTAIPLPFAVDPHAGPIQFAAGAEGILATINDYIWHSSDGHQWHMVYDAPRGTSVYGPVAGDEGWIVRRGNASLSTTTLLVSGDVATWYEVDLGNVGTISTVAGDWLATRYADNWERTEILRSPNGLDWDVVLDLAALPVEPSDLGAFDGATMTGTDEMLVLSPWQSGHCFSMPNGEDVFWSSDASTWASAGLDDGAVVTHAVEIGEVSVLVGYIATSGDVAFWVSAP